MIGLDTSAIIDIFKGKDSLRKLLTNTKEPLVATQMSYLELMFGLDPKNSQHNTEERYYDEFFKSILTFQLSKQPIKKASEIFWQLKRKGKSVEQFDCVIAGIFLANGINKIITNNVKHFERISELTVISY